MLRRALMAALVAAPLAAQAPAGPRTIVDTVIAPGVRWRWITDLDGPWAIHVVRIDLKGGRYEMRHVRSRDSVASREKLTDMVARQKEGAAGVTAAINGDFFNLQTGENENQQVIAGEWWKGMRGSDSPYDAFAAVRTHFAVDAKGAPLMDRFVLDGAAIHATGTIPVFAVNFLPKAGPETVALFTDRVPAVPADSTRKLADAPLMPAGRRGDSALYVVAAPVGTKAGRSIAHGTAALVAYGPRAAAVAKYAVGDTVRILLRAAARRGDGPFYAPQLLIGGWPRILTGGVNVAARAAWDEGTLSSNAEARHPRSAVGFSRDSASLFLAVVDGRQAASAGMTLVELADLLKAEGAWDALNFDGGGSTTLVIKGRIVNSVSDPTGERPVGNALLVVAKPR